MWNTCWVMILLGARHPGQEPELLAVIAIALSLSAFCSGVNFGRPELMTTDSEVELFSCFLNSCCRLIWASCANECSACWGCPISLSGLCRALSLTRTEQTPHSGCHAGHYNELLPFHPPVIFTSFPPRSFLGEIKQTESPENVLGWWDPPAKFSSLPVIPSYESAYLP